jgi:hypothetical protein
MEASNGVHKPQEGGDCGVQEHNINNNTTHPAPSTTASAPVNPVLHKHARFDWATNINKSLGPVPSTSKFHPTTPPQLICTPPVPTDCTSVAHMPNTPTLVNPDPSDVACTPGPAVSLEPGDAAADDTCAVFTDLSFADPIHVYPTPTLSKPGSVPSPLSNTTSTVPIGFPTASTRSSIMPIENAAAVL